MAIGAAHTPSRARALLPLMVALGLTESVSLLLLVPLLGLIGLDIGSGSIGRLAGLIRAAFAAVHLQPSIATVLALYILVIATRSRLKQLEEAQVNRIEQSFAASLRHRLFRAALYAPWGRMVGEPSGTLVHALTSATAQVQRAVSDGLAMTTRLIICGTYLVVGLFVAPLTALLTATAGIGLFEVSRWLSRRARASLEVLNARSLRMTSFVAELLTGMKTIRSYSVEARAMEHFTELNQDMVHASIEAERSYGRAVAWFTTGSAVILAFLVVAAVRIFAVPTATLLLLIFIFARVLPQFALLHEEWQHTTKGLAALSLIQGPLDRLEPDAAEHALPERRSPIPTGPIRLIDVDFVYPGRRGSIALRGVNLEVAPGSTTALVGPSGAGKSTVADLVLGLVMPSHGTVQLGTVELTREMGGAWREGIGYVGQDAVLFNDTIRANLLWADPRASDTQLWEALRQAAAEDFVARLPHGLDMAIGGQGTLLSGGERQRLCLARALLRKPALLILDEATSGLDPENERRIVGALERLQGRMMVLLITHRLSVARSADIIHVLDAGRILESGTWQELVAREGGRFQALALAQGVELRGAQRGDLQAGSDP